MGAWGRAVKRKGAVVVVEETVPCRNQAQAQCLLSNSYGEQLDMGVLQHMCRQGLCLKQQSRRLAANHL